MNKLRICLTTTDPKFPDFAIPDAVEFFGFNFNVFKNKPIREQDRGLVELISADYLSRGVTDDIWGKIRGEWPLELTCVLHYSRGKQHIESRIPGGISNLTLIDLFEICSHCYKRGCPWGQLPCLM